MYAKEEPGSFANRQYNPANNLLILLLMDFVAPALPVLYVCHQLLTQGV